MGRRCWLLLVLWTNVALLGQLKISSAYASDRGQLSVDFELYRDYLIVLHPTVGTLRGLNFMLDTGATSTVLDTRLAAKLHLDSVTTQIAVLQGTVQGWSATAPSVQLGPVVKKTLPVLVEDLSFIQKVLPVHLDGILGLDVLGQMAFTIDYQARVIRFGVAADLPVKVPLHMKQGLAMLDATVDQQSIHLLLDTGAPSLFLFSADGAPGAPAKEVRTSSVGDHDYSSIRLKNLTLGNANFSHPSAFIVASQRDAGHDFDGIVSPTALGITRLTVDLVRGELTFSQKP